MATPNPGALQVRAKSNQVVDYHFDDSRPGKPLYLLIPGGLIALASLLLMMYIAYRTWLDASLDQGVGMGLILLLAPVYAGGVFLFSYGYELYNLGKALRDTAIVVFITFAAVIIIAVLFAVLGALGKSSGSSSKSEARSSSSNGSSSSSSLGSGGGNWLGGVGPIIVGGGYPGPVTHEVTHEVVREVPTAPPLPTPIKCPSCGRSYIPAETHFACPNCGAPTPKDLIAESQSTTAKT
jgi:hypothetical protein